MKIAIQCYGPEYADIDFIVVDLTHSLIGELERCIATARKTKSECSDVWEVSFLSIGVEAAYAGVWDSGCERNDCEWHVLPDDADLSECEEVTIGFDLLKVNVQQPVDFYWELRRKHSDYDCFTLPISLDELKRALAAYEACQTS